MRIITRNIWLLSLVSLFTDVASEMLYPVMPIYLASIQFSVVLIGVLEGFAEAFAGLSKGYFGKLSDTMGKRLPFVQAGYLLSALSKPMLAAFSYVWWIFSARFLDRLGKGLRTGARDALLSDEATPETKARIFGFHRSLDTLGAVTGPLIALAYLYHHPGSYKTLFLIAFLPGLLAVAATLLIKEKRLPVRQVKERPSFLDFTRYFTTAPAAYRKVVLGLLLFALINSSDVFLLLKIRESLQSDTITIGLYIFYNLVFALSAYPLGLLADKIGLRRVYIAGLTLFVLTYALMASGSSFAVFCAAFLLYGLYAAATEGVSKAWLTNIAAKEHTATAIGAYTAFQSICALLASTFTGIIWMQLGSAYALAIPALCTAAIILYFVLATRSAAVKNQF